MARPKSEEKRRAIVAAAVRVMGAEGLGAATSDIAREAGVANGSVFTYFETKAALWNAVYVALKGERARAALKGFSLEGAMQNQFAGVWWSWMDWGLAEPEKRRLLALLGVSSEVTAKSRAAGERAMGGVRELLKRIHAQGAMRESPVGLMMALVDSAAEATMDCMVEGAEDRERVCRAGFEGVWRMIG